MIKQLKEQLATHHNVMFGYLFGSYAKQTQHDRSDVVQPFG